MGAYSYEKETKTTKNGRKIEQHMVFDWTVEPPRPKKFKSKKLALGFMKNRDQ